MKMLKLLLFIFFVSVVETISSQPIAIGISKTTDLHFGNIAVIGSGTVVITPGGTRTGYGVTLPSITGNPTPASFTVTGEPGYTYAISSLSLTSVSLTGPGASMTCDTFISSPTGGSGLLTGGTQMLYVGATLNIAAGQVAGTYTSGSFTITVNYN